MRKIFGLYIFSVLLIIINFLFFLEINTIHTYKESEDLKFSLLNDNSLIVYYEQAFTTEVQDRIINSNLTQSVKFGAENRPYIDYNYVYATGRYLPLDLIDITKFPIYKGRLPENNDEIIISKQFAESLVERDDISKPLIGQTITSTNLYEDTEIDYHIVGIFDNTILSNTEFYVDFFTINMPSEDDTVIEYIENNNDFIEYEEYNDNVEVHLPYDASYNDYVNAGYKGLIDPANKKLYGEEIKNIAYIETVDKEARNQLEKQFKDNFELIVQIDNESSISEFTTIKNNIANIKKCILLFDIVIIIQFILFFKFK